MITKGNRNRQIAIGEDARKNLLMALDFIAAAVGSTMGPGGRPFGYDKKTNNSMLLKTFSKDGLTVLRSLGFEDPAWEGVLEYAKQAASHSVLASGDGTSSTLILANAVAKVIYGYKSKAPQAFARQIEAEAQTAIKALEKFVCKDEAAARIVANTSTNGDTELTDWVMESLKHTGAYGTILVDKNPSVSKRYNLIKKDGYSYTNGYNHAQTLAVSASEEAASSKPICWFDPKVLLMNGQIMLEKQINPILAAWNKTLQDKPTSLVLVTYEISEEIINKLLIVNRTLAKQYGVGVFVVKPKLTAEIHSSFQIMRDIASYCGIEDHHIVDGGNYQSIDESFFGTCKEVQIYSNQTFFLGRATNNWVIDRIKQNQAIVDAALSQFDKQISTIRNAELADGLVRIEVGGGTMPELQERADRFDDASKAAQACLAAGAVVGGGLSYILAGMEAGVSEELQTALKSITGTVLENYGLEQDITDPNSIPLDGINGYKLTKEGITFGPAIELGVMDSYKTVAAVIKNGVSLGVHIATIGGYCFRPTYTDGESEVYE
jgi:chaperonin GroEL